MRPKLPGLDRGTCLSNDRLSNLYRCLPEETPETARKFPDCAGPHLAFPPGMLFTHPEVPMRIRPRLLVVSLSFALLSCAKGKEEHVTKVPALTKAQAQAIQAKVRTG